MSDSVQGLMNTTTPNFDHRHRLSTEPNSYSRTPVQLLQNNSVAQRHFRTTSDNSMRLKSENIIVGRRKKISSQMVKRRVVQKEEVQSTPYNQTLTNKCTVIQKEINRGGKLESKHIEEWLNSLLLEYCYQEKFDKSVRLSALKKFQVDRNSLTNKLLSQLQIDRLYRALLVYSVGFNKILKQVSKSTSVTKSIWRVYSLLTEYCAQGSFESTVGEIERQKAVLLNNLQEQLQGKDKLLLSMNQAEKINKAKAYKQLRHLKEEHVLLKNEKAIIEEDFKQADQAFSEQVNLRLKFEHKINQVNGVHRELGTKHLLLFQDFQNYKLEYEKLFKTREDLLQKVADLEAKLHRAQQNNQELQKKQAAAQQVITQLQSEMQLEAKKIRTEEKDRRNQYLNRKELEISHLEYQIQGLLTNSTLRDQALEKRVHEVAILVSENSRLHLLNEEQKGRIVQLEVKQNSYLSRTVHLKSLSQMLKKSLDEQTEINHQLSQQLQRAGSLLLEKEISLSSLTQVSQLMKANGQAVEANLSEMKYLNSALENKLADLEGKMISLDQLASNKQSLYGKAKIKLMEEKERAAQSEFRFKQLQITSRLQKESSQKSINALKHTISELKFQKFVVEEKNEKLAQTLSHTEVENYELRQIESKTRSYLRDQKFQRKQIDLQFKQSLLMVTGEKKMVQELTIEATQAKESRDRLAAKLKSVQFLFNQKQTILEAQISKLLAQLHAASTMVAHKWQWVHPMSFEDLKSKLTHWVQRFHTVNYLHQQLIKSLGPREEEANKRMRRLRKEFEYAQHQLKQELDRKLFSKEKELESKIGQKQRLAVEYDQVRRRLKEKTDYSEVVEDKLHEALLLSRELQLKLQKVKERNVELNRMVYEMEYKYDTLRAKAESESLKAQAFIQDYKTGENSYMSWRQGKNKQLRHESSDPQRILQENPTDANNPGRQLPTDSNQLLESNPGLQGQFSISKQHRKPTIHALSRGNNPTNRNPHRLHRTQTNHYGPRLDNFMDGSSDREAQQVSQPKEKQMTRKLRNAVSYYHRPSAQ